MNITREKRQARRRSTNERLMENVKVEAAEQQHKRFHTDHKPGATIHSPSHMIIEPTSEEELHAVESLQISDLEICKTFKR